MDYSQLSDFEINKLIGIASGKELMPDDFQDFGLAGFSEVMLRNGDFKDYCSDPADAWPIIVQNLIEVSPDYDFTDESEQELRATGLWTANHVEVDGKSYYQSHQNPLRAAMVVFLMMQGANHA